MKKDSSMTVRVQEDVKAWADSYARYQGKSLSSLVSDLLIAKRIQERNARRDETTVLVEGPVYWAAIWDGADFCKVGPGFSNETDAVVLAFELYHYIGTGRP